ncbi:carboxymethylenebutenolidase [Halolactibacillus miurensis]|uniref:Alpha/beta hydrolase family protein n=1 Tax=Halolactibacillus miurensis TaxID=306541 RepID=A0A1I6UWH0_9BACI|nr:alpha/beta hydrolase [Halolactibacillus miurensis]GEM05633.1 carboxymethylenebutenolidase [Halolactibacillus miurensis]SFT05788.1 Alpha/beta hydrolase family protein [Halolactibacillus miurensis]
MTKKKKLMKRIGFILIAVIILISLSAFIFLKINTYKPLEEASDMLDLPNVTETADWIKLSQNEPEVRLVFYPGGLVEPVSYVPLLEPLTDEGYEVFIIKMPLNLAILNADAIEDVQESEPTELPTYLSGHSLGGASASIYLSDVPEAVDGLVFLGAYPAENNDLSAVDFPVVSITASNDTILNWESFETSQSLLPEDTTYNVIEGGNHANFGSYGKQDGDGENTISREEQQTTTRRIFTDLIGK